MNKADANSFYLYDGLGSVKQLTDSNESVVASYTYDSFGNVISSVGSVANTYGFTGQQQFNEADSLVFLRARYYNPSIGRFISRDPILVPIQMGGYVGWILPHLNLIHRPQSLHPYVYVHNNPINFADPRGLGTWSCIKDALKCSDVVDVIGVIGVAALYVSCVAGCGSVTGGVGVGPCLFGCLAAVVGGYVAGLILACL